MGNKLYGTYGGHKNSKYEIDSDDVIFAVVGFRTRNYNPNHFLVKMFDFIPRRRWFRRSFIWKLYVPLYSKLMLDIGSRTFGYYKTFEQAEAAVLENRADINEGGYYDIMLIEAIYQGMYPTAFEIQWYRWLGGEEGYYMKGGRPDRVFNVTKGISIDYFKNTINFGL